MSQAPSPLSVRHPAAQPRRAVASRLAAAAVLVAAVLVAPATRSASAASPPPIDTRAREAFMIDFDTNAVLLDLRGGARMPPASMSKIMTAYIVFERLRDGRLKLNDKLLVSDKASKAGGSTMFLRAGTRVSVEDLIRGLIIQSGNDAAIVLAEGLAGSEDAFALQMTEKGREIGLVGSSFANATGLPDPQHYMTARDLAVLSAILIRRFPEYYKLYSETSFKFADVNQPNRNPLLGRVAGADGVKTGHTDEAGYCLTASVKRDGRRLILVLGGLPDTKLRGSEAERIIEWGFREFANYPLFAAGEPVTTADVWLGTRRQISLVVAEPLVVTLPVRARRAMKVSVVYPSTVQAPVVAGSQILFEGKGRTQRARVVVTAPGLDPAIEVPLVAGGSADLEGPVTRVFSAARYMFLGQEP